MVLKCRSCLVKVESQESVNIFTTTKAGQLISDFLLSLAPIQILNNDGLPTNLCRSCEEKVNVLVDFRTLLLTSDAELRKMRNTSVTNENQALIKEEILEVYLNSEEALEEKYDRNQASDFCCDSPTWQENKQSKSRMKDNIETVDPLFDCPLPITQEDLLQNLVKEELMNEDFLLEDETTETITNLTEDSEEQMEETASCSNDADEMKSPLEDSEVARVATLKLPIPEKSRQQYELGYKRFKSWCASKKLKNFTENTCLAYFYERAKHVKPPTLWSEFTMVKASLLLEEDIDLKQYFKLIDYLKRQSTGYHSKKPKIFNKDQICKFVNEAPDDRYLMMKVVAIFGVAGACRRDEFAKMSIHDVEDTGSVLVVKIPTARTNNPRSFVIDCETIDARNMIETYRKYVALRPPATAHERLFVQYRNAKCSVQPVGINTFGKIPSEIARYLGLVNPQEYTGHCFRRSSATIVRKRIHAELN